MSPNPLTGPSTAPPVPPGQDRDESREWPLIPAPVPGDEGKLPLANDVYDPRARHESGALPGVDLPILPGD